MLSFYIENNRKLGGEFLRLRTFQVVQFLLDAFLYCIQKCQLCLEKVCRSCISIPSVLHESD